VNHVTVSRRHSNGTFDDLGHIEALGDYVELVRRLTSWSSEHPRYVRISLLRLVVVTLSSLIALHIIP
jgi:hypothetical protein